MKFKFLSHTADIKFRAYGKSIEEVCENSAYAVISAICGEKIKNKKKIKIKVSGRDILSLLYNFLEEVLFLADSRSFFVSKVVNIKIDKKKFKLSAEFIGDYGKNYKTYSHIKAVTYNDMFLKKEKGMWVAQVVLDV